MLAVGLLFLLIGIISFSVSNILFATFIIGFVILAYNIGKKPIDRIEKDLKQNEEYINSDPKEVQKEFIKDVEKKIG